MGVVHETSCTIPRRQFQRLVERRLKLFISRESRIHLKFRLTFDGPGSGGVHQFRFTSDERVHAQSKMEHVVSVHTLVELGNELAKVGFSKPGKGPHSPSLFAVDAFTRVISGP